MLIKEESPIDIFTDGACKGNPGPGGWGAILRYHQHEKHLKGYEPLTTNNRMELMAVIMALKLIKRNRPIRVTSDSKYVQQGVTIWLAKWKKNHWKTSQKTTVKNIDLWSELDEIVQKYQINWFWVRGHNNHYYNELADKLANDAIRENLCEK